MRQVSLLAAVLLLGACGKQEAKPAAAASASPLPVTVPTPAAPRAKPRAVKEETPLYIFEYGYPAEAAAIPALAAKFDAAIASERKQLIADAREGQKGATDMGIDFNPYSSSVDWQVVTRLPRWLSLSALVGSYTGGAHPNYVFTALLWDRDANRERSVVDLFTSKQALTGAIRGPFCDALDKEREKKRGEPVVRDDEDWMNACIDPVGETIIPGSADKQHFTRMGVLVSPYNAGPYAEGSYEVTLPVTPAIIAAVKPEYRQYFAVKR